MLPGISVINDERPVASLAFTGLFHLARRRLAALRSGNNQETEEDLEEGRRAFKVNSRRKFRAKKTEFQTGSFPGLSFRR